MDFISAGLLDNAYIMTGAVGLFILSSLLYITQLLKQEKEHSKVRSAREMEDQARKDFVSNINHEIRTPVNVISGMLHLIFQQNLDRQTQSYVEKIKVANTDIKNVIDDALDFNKLYSGEIITNDQELNFYNFMEAIKEDFTLQAEQKRLSIHFLIDEQIPKRIKVDEYLLRSICKKLLDNSIKFTDKGEINFKVDLLQGNDSVIRLGFEISDTGIGMKTEQVQGIFRAFQQGDGSKSRSYGGIGVGLFLVKKMLVAMKSDLKIDSILGKGSKFNFSLLLEYIGDDLSDEDICKGKKVMFVDDDIINREIGQSLLNQLGVESTILSSGQEALDSISDSFDLVILDIKMPEMDGTEVAETIKSNGYDDLPIIALTGNAEEQDIESYKQAGMIGCIAKPIDFEILKSSIADVFKAKGKSIEFKKVEKSDLLNSSELLTFEPGKGLRLINNDKELFYGILAKFRKNFGGSADKLHYLMESKDFKTCEILAHSIKGVAVNIGATPLSKAAKDLEVEFKLRNKADIALFTNELNKVIIEIDKYLENHTDDNMVETGSKKKGTLDELRELLNSLQESLTRSDPVQSKDIIKEIYTYSFSDLMKEPLKEIADNIDSYEFAEAIKNIDSMIERLEE